MANVNAPSGFKPKRHANGGVVRSNEYQIVGALAANIYRGSAVINVNTSKRITVAAAGNKLAGIFQGCSYVDATGQPQFRPFWASGQTILTGTIARAEVYDDPDILFGCQVSGSAGLVATDIGNFADLVVGTGSQATGTSGDMLDQSTLGTTSGQFRIEDLDPIQGNDFGQYAKALVRINEHEFGPDATTLGNRLSAV